jgi:putative transposase
MARRKQQISEQVVNLLRQIEVAVANGNRTSLSCKEAEITKQTYYRWRKEYGGLPVDHARRLMELESENAKLKRLVCKRLVGLSITHKFRTKDEAELDVCEACKTSPDDGVSWWSIFGSSQVASELGELSEIKGECAVG